MLSRRGAGERVIPAEKEARRFLAQRFRRLRSARTARALEGFGAVHGAEQRGPERLRLAAALWALWALWARCARPFLDVRPAGALVDCVF